ncbi:hypothetical protein MHYMCMPSP_00856 [Hyalomma marginatum]|uniref:Uncharacterized protein n=1 Tax=Hyalomma marginatum TaxID=34627 RepID=A0A8S4BWF5_9ACAR|nr:hypothetical protein MHYMCMPASI_00681 [Hyalomma marginatum]CAG7594201.1 hypothetical protein MHYMCMPSP_00856 [Hyalomma marginatum]
MFNATFDSSSLNGKNDFVIESSGTQTYVSSAVLMMLLLVLLLQGLQAR